MTLPCFLSTATVDLELSGLHTCSNIATHANESFGHPARRVAQKTAKTQKRRWWRNRGVRGLIVASWSFVVTLTREEGTTWLVITMNMADWQQQQQHEAEQHCVHYAHHNIRHSTNKYKMRVILYYFARYWMDGAQGKKKGIDWWMDRSVTSHHATTTTQRMNRIIHRQAKPLSYFQTDFLLMVGPFHVLYVLPQKTLDE